MEKDPETENAEPLVHEFNTGVNSNKLPPKIIALLVGVVVLGIVSGYYLSGNSSKAGNITSGSVNLSNVPKGTVVGSNDTKTFKDTAEGNLKDGGIQGEGAFHLVRPGGDNQNVYLTSSSVDLSKLVGKKVKVWGQTQKAQHAGWLMDVGRVEVL